MGFSLDDELEDFLYCNSFFLLRNHEWDGRGVVISTKEAHDLICSQIILVFHNRIHNMNSSTTGIQEPFFDLVRLLLSERVFVRRMMDI